jgi:hypothetical protein
MPAGRPWDGQGRTRGEVGAPSVIRTVIVAQGIIARPDALSQCLAAAALVLVQRSGPPLQPVEVTVVLDAVDRQRPGAVPEHDVL